MNTTNRMTMRRETRTMMTDSKRLRDAVTKRVKKALARTGNGAQLMFDRATGNVWYGMSSEMPLATLAQQLGVLKGNEYAMMTRKMPTPVNTPSNMSMMMSGPRPTKIDNLHRRHNDKHEHDEKPERHEAEVVAR